MEKFDEGILYILNHEPSLLWHTFIWHIPLNNTNSTLPYTLLGYLKDAQFKNHVTKYKYSCERFINI